MLAPFAVTRHLPYPPAGPHVWFLSMHQFLPSQTLSLGLWRDRRLAARAEASSPLTGVPHLL